MAEPHRSRPGFDPGYGIAADSDGLLSWDWAVERLTRSRNYWIATTRPDGRPHAMPVWGLWLKDAVVFGTGRRSAKARNLGANPAVVAHLESGDEVVIVEGLAERLLDANPELTEAYTAKYGIAVDRPSPHSPPWFAVRPRRAYAWLESDYPNTATVFTFG